MSNRVFLTGIDGKEWYYNPETDDIEWRVPDVREVIKARPGHVILAADFSQIEIKIVAFISQDKDLIAAINSGKDIHSYITTEIFGQKLDFDYDLITLAKSDKSHPRNKELDLLRSRTKAIVFGTIYGAGASKVALMTGMSIDEAQEFIDAFMSKYATLKAWLDKAGFDAITKGFSVSLNGRKRFYHLPDISDRDYDKIISQIKRWGSNGPIQMSGADMLKLAMKLIYLAVRGGKFTNKPKYSARFKLVVHDEIVMECLEQEKEECKQIIHKCMTEAYDYFIQGINNKLEVLDGLTWQH